MDRYDELEREHLGDYKKKTGIYTTEVKYFSEGEDIKYGNSQAAGIDLPFYDPELEEYTFKPFERKMLKTGVHMEIPEGYYGHVDTRSSTGKAGCDLLCHTIDQDYRGNLRLMLINLSNEEITIKRGQFLCQLILTPVLRGRLRRVGSVDELSATERGDGGFGSTGRNF